MATGTAFAASAAQAATVAECGAHDGATSIELIGSNICSVVFSKAGDYSFTAPAGVTQLEALLVGGGGAGQEIGGFGYAGGSGEVKYVSQLEAVVTHSIHVGQGGKELILNLGLNGQVNGDIDPRNGEQSSLGNVLAQGGYFSNADKDPFSTLFGSSGNRNKGFGFGPDFWYPIWGGGAKSAATGNADGITAYPGAGFLPSDPTLTLGSPLFPAHEGDPELGRGGTFISAATLDVQRQNTIDAIEDSISEANASNSQSAEEYQLILNNGAQEPAPLPTQSLGWGGSASSSSGEDGADGGVIFRFFAPAPSLANTGAVFSGIWGSVVAVSLVIAGSLGLRVALRRDQVNR